MLRKFKVIIFLLLLLLVSHISEHSYANAAGSVYYVDQDHDRAVDNQLHGSINKPWRTLAYAFQQLEPGDTLLIRRGVYNNDRIQLDASNSGASRAPITVKAYPNERVVLANGQEIVMYGLRWWVIDGLIFRGFKGNSIFRLGRSGEAAAHITIRNSIFRDSKAEPITLLYSRDILIENNEFLRINTGREGEGVHGINILFRVKRVTISNNKFLDISADGIHLGASSAPVIEDINILRNEFGLTNHKVEWGENGVDVKGVDGPVLIKENYFHGFRPTYLDSTGHNGNSNGVGVVIHLGAHWVQVRRNVFEDNTIGLTIADQRNEGFRSTRNIRVQNNIIKDSRDFAGNAHRPPGAGIGLTLNNIQNNEVEVYHNTFVNNDIYLNTPNVKVEAVFRNNAIWGGRASISSKADIISSNNAWSETEGNVPRELRGPDDLRSVSDFKLDSQFRPRSTSRLIDRGFNIGLRRDFEGKRRTDGKPDIGAFEFVSNITTAANGSTRLYLPVLVKSGQP